MLLEIEHDPDYVYYALGAYNLTKGFSEGYALSDLRNLKRIEPRDLSSVEAENLAHYELGTRGEVELILEASAQTQPSCTERRK